MLEGVLKFETFIPTTFPHEKDRILESVMSRLQSCIFNKNCVKEFLNRVLGNSSSKI